MVSNQKNIQDFSLNQLRVKDLLGLIKQKHPEIKKGSVVLFGAFEQDRYKFRQESSFYYFTGITEPGTIAVFNLDGTSTLYVPEHGTTRAAWVHTPVALVQENAKKLGFTNIIPLGDKAPGYQMYPFSDKAHYKNIIEDLNKIISNKDALFTLMPDNSGEYTQERFILSRFEAFIPSLQQNCIDICPLVAILRRKKDMSEIETIYKAVEITILAQGAAAQAIEDGITECEVQASLEYMFTGSNASPAFASIVATGKNATVLHYTKNCDQLKNGQLVVVDVGAEFNYYCADLTRTYPVSGMFTKRQRELYNLVLDTQEYIAERAKPGMWLSNSQKPEKSLQHLAKKFLDDRGYGNYFTHGIAHFMGLDVHDVGDRNEPLQEGDVFTIEPGIYIPEENIGIRIEDNYWMVKDHVVCLSEALPKKAEAIEAFMQEIDEDTTDESIDEIDDNDLTDDFTDEEELDLAHG